ncbi:MAG: LuxR C-terminal-related transcriptional regulator [Chloroflexi bacterium OHK40]
MSTPPLADDFGTWLRRLRRQRDRTQEALADEVGCAVYTLRAIEAGRRRPSREMAERLAAVLGLPAEQWPRFVQLARSGQAPKDEVPAAGSPAPGTPTASLPELLSTKLYAPPPPLHAIPRARLLALLAARPTRLTLVVAPPGFGKSTLLAQLLAQPGERSAWLSLDADDDEPARFLAAVIAALQQQLPGIGTGAINLLRMSPGAQPQAVLTALINDLRGRSTPLALVLNDYHTISGPEIHELLTTLVERGPPELRLLLAARVDPPLPLARWRARGLLQELRAADLRFDRDEATAFLVDRWGLALSDEQVALLEARTEGWAAGLQLAGLSLQGRAEPVSFLTAFSGSHRYVFDYLMTETLGGLPAHLRAFLLQTSVLRRLAAPLCDAVLGLSGSGEDKAYSGLLLAELERRNLFLIPLDDGGRWWRYHHLFGEVLQSQLRAGVASAEVAALHRRAAQWYTANGEHEEALHHALAGGATDLAAELLERLAPILAGDHAIPSLLRQIRVLPDEVLVARPELAAYATWALIESGQAVEAGRLVAAAVGRLPANASATDRGHLLGAQAHLALVRDQYDESKGLAREALNLLDRSATPFRREILDTLNAACDCVDDIAGALEAATASVQLLRGLGQNTLAPEVQVARSIAVQGRMAEAEGQLKQLLDRCTDQSGGFLPAAVLPLKELARLYAVRGEFIEARATAAQALAVAEEYHLTYQTLAALWTLAFIALCRRELAVGWEYVRRNAALAAQTESIWLRAIADGLEGEFTAFTGDNDRAAGWAMRALHLLNATDIIPPHLRDYARSCMNVLLVLGRAHDSLSLATRMLAPAQTGGNQRQIVFMELVQALALQGLGRREEAQATLEQAVRRAAVLDAVSPFLTVPASIAALLPAVRPAAPAFIDQVLALLRDRDGELPTEASRPSARREAAAHQELDEALSERELEVLRLLAAGHSNQAIADKLIIAVGTVKRHLHSIFGKLSVDSRTEAIARAHTLGLLIPPAR